MKKNKIILLSAVVLIFSFMSIGSGSSETTGQKQIADSTDQDSSGDPSSAAESGEGNANAGEPTNSESDVPTIEEQVLIDEDGLKVTAKEYVTDSIWGDGVALLIENNGTSDIGIGCNALIVNDYMITDLFSSTVAAGKKANETMHLSSVGLKAAGIENVGQIEMYFHTFDADSYMTIKDYPCSVIKTSEYANMDESINDEGKELYNDNGIRIVGKYVDENSFWGAAVLLYIENNSGKNVYVQCDDMSVNGFMMTPYFSSSVYDGKKAIDDITLLSTELEQNGISSIDEIELKFRISDENFTTIAETEPISFTTK